MVNLEKIVQVADAFCSCVPVLSTITNGGQLLYRLASRVDAAANPIAPGLKTEIKIHTLNKTAREILIGIIPIVGNIILFVQFCLNGLKNQLNKAILSNNAHVVRLCIAQRRPEMDDATEARQILRHVVLNSNQEIVSLILNGRSKWTIQDLASAVPQEAQHPRVRANASVVLNHCVQIFPGKEVPGISADCIKRNIQSAVDVGQIELAGRLTLLLPGGRFTDCAHLLINFSFNYQPHAQPQILSQRTINDILHWCEPLSIDQFTEYCVAVHLKRERIMEHAPYGDRNRMIQENIQFHSTIVERLLSLVDMSNEQEPFQKIVGTLSWLACLGERDLFIKALNKLEREYNFQTEHILEILNICSENNLQLYSQKVPQQPRLYGRTPRETDRTREGRLEIFRSLLDYYQDDISEIFTQNQLNRLRISSWRSEGFSEVLKNKFQNLYSFSRTY